MVEISNFNSLWEIAFATNAIFVYFDLLPVLESKFKGTQALGVKFISLVVPEKDLEYINAYGWRSILFGYTVWVSRLKSLSVINSIISIFLVVLAGYSPDLDLGFTNILIIIVLFFPVIFIPAIVVYGLPMYKLKCIEEAVYLALERDNLEPAIKEVRIRKNRITIEFIKLTTFPVLFYLIRDKRLTIKEVLEEFNQ
ncbi:hypothetical protein [Candidatus Methylobacter oryzae]|uniref:Uncharacterized protein n=1 Tax=Candidatus Methylobacter oryzae TaxID=2497749 RepID=A0ABY3C6K9_9GAMM|nr:hypothetical protein [Candidatus Methylobacter oryzae]TRW91225.1 hypothetical protein EKO24_017580 [Candidatus Methylobacter oryzae]